MIETEPQGSTLLTEQNKTNEDLEHTTTLPTTIQQKYCIPPGIQKKALKQVLLQNVSLYFVLLVCLYALARAGQRSFICTLVTVIVASFLSFYINYGYNCLYFQSWYASVDTMLTRCPLVQSVLQTTTIDGKNINTSTDTLWNYVGPAFRAGGLLLVIKGLLNLADTKTILFWALMYPSVHNINYYFLKPRAHMAHHIYPCSNYGIDIWDLVFGTKHNWNDIEIHNHAAVNSIVITALILCVSKYMGW